jgi:hypothetical protein
MSSQLRWDRRFANSNNNFDLVLKNPDQADPNRLNKLLEAVVEEYHRGLTLSSRAQQEFKRWFSQPETPLLSAAYVLLSNWFLTKGGDRNSLVAGRCEALWDALFPCRPLDRLSSPQPGRNHLIIPSEFDNFWRCVLRVQGNDDVVADGEKNEDMPNSNTSGLEPHSETSEIMKATLDKAGIRCEIEGSPRALANFLQIVSKWDPS